MVNYSENVQKLCLLWVLLLQCYLFCNFLKNAPEYIDPSGHLLMTFFEAQTSITLFFLFLSKRWKNIFAFNKSIITISESSFGIHIQDSSGWSSTRKVENQTFWSSCLILNLKKRWGRLNGHFRQGFFLRGRVGNSASSEKTLMTPFFSALNGKIEKRRRASYYLILCVSLSICIYKTDQIAN